MKLETSDFVREAADVYLIPEAAGRLLEVKARARGELLERAARALEHLDPERVHVPEPAWSFVRSVAQVVVAMLYETDRKTRVQLAPALQRLIDLGAAAGRRERAEAVALRRALIETAAWEARELDARRWRESRESDEASTSSSAVDR